MGKRTHSTTLTAAPAKDAVSYDPVDCLLLWCIVLDEEHAEEALKPFGIGRDELERIKQANPELLEQMRKLRMAGRLMVRGRLAMLLRARLGAELMACRGDAKATAQLTTAMSRMALWMFWLPPGKDISGPTREEILNAEAMAHPDELPKMRYTN